MSDKPNAYLADIAEHLRQQRLAPLYEVSTPWMKDFMTQVNLYGPDDTDTVSSDYDCQCSIFDCNGCEFKHYLEKLDYELKHASAIKIQNWWNNIPYESDSSSEESYTSSEESDSSEEGVDHNFKYYLGELDYELKHESAIKIQKWWRCYMAYTAIEFSYLYPSSIRSYTLPEELDSSSGESDSCLTLSSLRRSYTLPEELDSSSGESDSSLEELDSSEESSSGEWLIAVTQRRKRFASAIKIQKWWINILYETESDSSSEESEPQLTNYPNPWQISVYDESLTERRKATGRYVPMKRGLKQYNFNRRTHRTAYWRHKFCRSLNFEIDWRKLEPLSDEYLHNPNIPNSAFEFCWDRIFNRADPHDDNSYSLAHWSSSRLRSTCERILQSYTEDLEDFTKYLNFRDEAAQHEAACKIQNWWNDVWETDGWTPEQEPCCILGPNGWLWPTHAPKAANIIRNAWLKYRDDTFSCDNPSCICLFERHLRKLDYELKRASAIKIQNVWDKYFKEYLCEVKYKCWSSSDSDSS